MKIQKAINRPIYPRIFFCPDSGSPFSFTCEQGQNTISNLLLFDSLSEGNDIKVIEVNS